MRDLGINVLVNLRDRLSGGLGRIRRMLGSLGNLRGSLGIDRVGAAIGGVVRQARVLVGLFAAGGALGGLGAGAVFFANQMAQARIELDNMAKRAGVTVEALSGLSYAGSFDGVDMDAITDGIKEMQLRFDEFIMTGEGPAKEAIARLGLTANDLAAGLENPEQLFLSIVEQLEDLDRAAQIRIADELFGGTGGEKFVQMLGRGREGIEALIEEGRAIGLVLTQEQVDAARQYGEAVKGVTDRLTGLRNLIADDLYPILTPLAEQTAAWIDAHRPEIIERVSSAVSRAAEVLPALASATGDMIDKAMFLARGMAHLVEALGGIETVAAAAAAAMSAKLILAVGNLGLALMTTPIGWFVGAMTGAVYLIQKDWDDFAPHMEETMGGVRRVFEGDVAGIEQALDGLSGFAATFGDKLTENLAPLGRAASVLGERAWADIRAVWSGIAWDTLGADIGAGLASALQDAGSLALDLWDRFWAGWNGIDFGQLGRTIMGGLIDGTVAIVSFVVDMWASFLGAWGGQDFDRLGTSVLGGLGSAVRGIGDFVFGFYGELLDRFLALDWSGMLEVGSEIMDGILEGLKAQIQKLLDWFKSWPALIREAIGNIDLSSLITFRRPWSSDEAAPAESGSAPAGDAAPARPLGRAPPQRQSSLALPGASQMASLQASAAAPAIAGAPAASTASAAQRQDVDVGGTIRIQVDGPGRVTEATSANRNVAIAPTRGASLALT